MNTYTDYLGIDISKESFDVVNREGKHFQYINSPKGFAEFKKEIPKDSLSTMEYTGIYHLNLAKFLYSKRVSVAVENPLRIKRFSQMHLKRNKTDKSDAKIISLYSQNQDANLWSPEPKEIEQSKDIYQIMEQYIEFRAGLKNKIDALKYKDVPQSIIEGVKSQIENMNQSIDELQTELDNLVKEFDAPLLSNISSIVGIGQRQFV